MKTLLIFLLLGLTVFAEAQTVFQRLYRNTNTSLVAQLTVANQVTDGGCILAGMANLIGATDQRGLLFIKRTDSLGNSLWSKTYDSLYDYCEPRSVLETHDGGFAIVGTLAEYGPGGFDNNLFVMKADDTGKVIWQTTYGGIGAEIGFSITETTDSNYMILGRSTTNGVYLIKLSQNGTLLWTKTYADLPAVIPFGRFIRNTLDGNYIIAGEAPTGNIPNDFCLIKIDTIGNILWAKSYGGVYPEVLLSFDVTNDGGFILAGKSNSFTANHGISSGYILKTDSTGNVEWSKIYENLYSKEIRSVKQTSNNGFILGGTTDVSIGNGDYSLIRTDEFGNIAWAKAYGQTGAADDVQLVDELKYAPGFFIAGRKTAFPSGYTGYHLIKTTDSGKTACSFTTIAPMATVVVTNTGTIGFTIFSTLDSSVGVTSIASTNGEDSTVCLTLINHVTSPTAPTVRVYPSPAIGILTFEASQPIEAIDIFDVNGKHLFSRECASEKVTINLDGFAAGLYVFRTRHKTEERRGTFVLQHK